MALSNTIAAEANGIGGGASEQAFDQLSARRLREAGVEAIHVRVDDDANSFERLARLLGEILEPEGLRLSSIDVGQLDRDNPASQSPESRGRSLRAIRSACRFAAEHGAEIVVVSPGRPESGVPYQATLDAARQTLSQAERYSSHAGVRIALATPAEGFLRSPAELRRLIDHVDPAAIGAAVDLGGLVAAGEPFPENWIREMGQALALVRATDYSLREPRGPRRCGQGDVPWSECFLALNEVGYGGAFVIRASDSAPLTQEAVSERAKADVSFLIQQLGRPAFEEVNQ